MKTMSQSAENSNSLESAYPSQAEGESVSHWPM